MPFPSLQVSSIRDGDLLAAVDLGSNSFHMVLARYTMGQLRVMDRLKETVRLADGLDAKGRLSDDAMDRAIQCLRRFNERVRNLPPSHIRALATNTVRQLAEPNSFLIPAEAALGQAIEIVSGREEARLIYLGVAHAQPPKAGKLRLVIDIGGGSTEFIIGRGFATLERESLQAGCIASTRRFFANGKLSKKKWKDATTEITAEFQQFSGLFRTLGWQEALGSSGTHKAIGDICIAMKLTKGAITAEALAKIRERLLEAKTIQNIDLPGLSTDRKPIIAGGILILESAFRALGLRILTVSKAAMREGILYDMLGRGGDNDPRDTSISSMSQRYGIDDIQAARVEATALRLFEQVAKTWQLDNDDLRMLGWAASLHELGLIIAHSQYHLHGAYVLEYSDIAGFSRQEQQVLATLVRAHRRAIPKALFNALPDRLITPTRRTAALLRLAVLLHRSHENDLPPRLELNADGAKLALRLSKTWLHSHPLLRADLIAEMENMTGLGIKFQPTEI